MIEPQAVVAAGEYRCGAGWRPTARMPALIAYALRICTAAAPALGLLLVLSSCALLRRPQPQPIDAPELPTVSDDAADSLLVDVQRLDTTIVVDVRYATDNNFTRARLPGYEANRAYLRAEAAAALALVNADLRLQGLGLKVFDGYRPVRASEAMLAWAERTNRPDLLRDGYIARRSRHNLGAAVDLTIITLATRAELAMGTPFDTFGPVSHMANARGIVAKNRQLLRTVMERHGFAGYEKEWWHYSYVVANPVRFDRDIR